MRIIDILSKLSLDILAKGDLEKEIQGCYVSDMLSDVLANSHEGNLWITRQTHPNIIAVASIKGMCGIIVTGGKSVEAETLVKAESEQVSVLGTPLSSFEIAGIFYTILKRAQAVE